MPKEQLESLKECVTYTESVKSTRREKSIKNPQKEKKKKIKPQRKEEQKTLAKIYPDRHFQLFIQSRNYDNFSTNLIISSTASSRFSSKVFPDFTRGLRS